MADLHALRRSLPVRIPIEEQVNRFTQTRAGFISFPQFVGLLEVGHNVRCDKDQKVAFLILY